MEVVVDIANDTIIQFTSPPAGGAGGKCIIVGRMEDVFSVKSTSMLCNKAESPSEYIVIQFEDSVVGVLPNTLQGQNIATHNVNNYKTLGKCILHFLPINGTNFTTPYKRIQVL